MSAGHEYEEVESIPWSSLVAEAKPRPLLAYVAGAVLVALALGLLAGRMFLDRPAAEPVAAPLTTATVAPTTVASGEVPADPNVPPSHLALAEWFVTDYFTDDGDDQRARDLSAVLGGETPAPLVATASYVEWARAWEALDTSSGSDVTVVFRTITATEDGFSRDPVRAVAVAISQVGGRPAVAGPPRPAAVSLAGPASLDFSGIPPAEVMDAALSQVASWGETAVVEGAAEQDGSWSVLVRVTDHRGNSWPLATRVEMPVTDRK